MGKVAPGLPVEVSEDCVFCDIVAGRAEASVVDADEHVVAFMDIEPVNDGHVLVVPRVHAASLEELDGSAAQSGTDWLRSAASYSPDKEAKENPRGRRISAGHELRRS